MPYKHFEYLADKSKANRWNPNLQGEIALPKRATVVLHRGYIDFARLHGLTQRKINFVVRCRSNLRHRMIAEFDVDETTGLRADQRITLAQTNSLKKYPDQVRRVEFYDDIHRTDLAFWLIVGTYRP